MAKGGMLYDMEVMNELMAQTYAAAIRWPKDKILEIRLMHIISCVEHGLWPVPDDYALGDHLEEEVEEAPAAAATEKPAPQNSQSSARDTSTPMSQASDASAEDAGKSARSLRGRKPPDFPDDKTSKIRSLLQQGPDSANDDAR